MPPLLSDRTSIPSVIAAMSPQEKAGLITGESPFRTRAIPRLGIPSVLLLDGGTGVNFLQLYMELMFRAVYAAGRDSAGEGQSTGMEAASSFGRMYRGLHDPSVLSETERGILETARAELDRLKPSGQSPGCFPPGILLGATWDPSVIYDCARALAREAKAYQVDILLGSPNVNIHRDPLNGRLFEGYSEDPFLVSRLAPAFVRGTQDEGLAANVKHFAANNQETNRMGIDQRIPVRALHEIYFPGFRACVEAGVQTVMSAYNQINGTACAMNSWLLTDILRDEWGFSGLVVSDWGAAYEQVAAAAAGNDLVMPGPRAVEPLLQAVADGSLDEGVLDRCAARFLEVLVELPVMRGGRAVDIDTAGSDAAAYKAAAAGMVLLKNANALLPLESRAECAFFGEKCDRFIESGGGSAEVWTDRTTSVRRCVEAKIGTDSVTVGEMGPSTDVVLVAVGARGQEGSDRPCMDLDPDDRNLLLQTVAAARRAAKPVVVILNVAGPVEMREWIDDVDAVLCVFFPGMEGGRAAADILFGDINPSGKLPLTFPRRYQDCPSYGNFPGECGEVWYGEGIFVGYRWYDMRDIEPLFPFGFGLSYTTFALADLQLPTEWDKDKGGALQFSVTVRNAGPRSGSEVVQAYVSQAQSHLKKPCQELKAFCKVHLRPGESVTVPLEVTRDALASFDPELDGWTLETGTYTFHVGTSSRDLPLQADCRVRGSNPYAYGPKTGIAELLQDDRAVAVLKRYIGSGVNLHELLVADLIFHPQRAFGEVWTTRLVPLLGGRTAEDIETAEAALYTELKEIE